MRDDTRSPNTGEISGLSNDFTPEFSLQLFQRGIFARLFDLKVKKAFDNKRIQIPVYLSIGQEFNAAAYSMTLEDFDIFLQKLLNYLSVVALREHQMSIFFLLNNLILQKYYL